MEVQVSPTPEETNTSDIERELLSSPVEEEHRPSAAEGEIDRETEGDASVKRKILSKMGRKMLKRLLGGVEYKTALATVLRDLNMPVATPEKGGPSTSKASKRLQSDDSCPGAEAKNNWVREPWTDVIQCLGRRYPL
ncbi:hypothetical protein JTB14_034742 [Gonioctena quinquepunctata]|nr:hypothetical protein JTB14_034742 [Gonioctena quinquepunctata]